MDVKWSVRGKRELKRYSSVFRMNNQVNGGDRHGPMSRERRERKSQYSSQGHYGA